MKKAFWNKVAESNTIVQTGRYLYEYDRRMKAVHVVDTKGVVDKWVKETDCEDYLFVKATPAPKAKTTHKATPAPKEETVTLTKGELSDIIAQAVAQAMSQATPAATPKATPAPKKSAHQKTTRKTAEPDNKYARTVKGDLPKSQQEKWDAIKAAVPSCNIVAYGTWLYVTGTNKNDMPSLKAMGGRWSKRRQCVYFAG